MESLLQMLLSNALAATVLALLAAGMGRLFRRPALTHSLWLLVLLKLITPPLVPVTLPTAWHLMPTPGHTDVKPVAHEIDPDARVAPRAERLIAESTGFVDSEPGLPEGRFAVEEPSAEIAEVAIEPRSVLGPDRMQKWTLGLPTGWKWEQWALVVILSGAVGWWGLAAVRIVRFQRLLRDVPPEWGELQSHTDELAAHLGLDSRPAAYLVPGRVPPMLWAIGGQPRLLLPSELWATMGEDERTSLLLHELAHLKRRDHWVRWLELIVAGLYWWHPVLWWARSALREAEEQCCDAWVVWAMPRRARTYAAALLAAVEFVSGARATPAAASATSGSGHVSCLKRRLKMIVRSKTPRSLSWTGRIAVLGTAALLLPLAPSWGYNNQSTPADMAELRDSPTPGDRGAEGFASQNATENHLDELVEQEEGLGKQKYDMLFELAAKDDDKDKTKDDKPRDDKELDDKASEVKEKARDAAEHFQEQLTDLIGKLGEQFSPVTEEIRKALDRAVGEVHKSLDKENLSVEELGKALEKSQDELRKAFEGGGPVNNQLREAIEKSRNELQGALERGKAEVQGQVETLREKSRELTDQARENLERAKEAVEKGAAPGDEVQSSRQELEAARKEIRDLEEQLRRSTRRFEELQRRETRRPALRRERNGRGADRDPRAPRTEPVEPQAPREPASPAVRPNPPASPRRPLPPGRPGMGGMRRGPQQNNERRIEELEEKMKSLLKELENIKDDKQLEKPKEEKDSAKSTTPASGGSKPTGTAISMTF